MALATTCLAEGKFFTFLGGIWADFPEGLHNFWAEQLTATQNCTISGLSIPAGRNCAIFSVKLDKNICTILEPNKLPDIIVHFLEGRMVPLENYAIYWGSCSGCN